MTLKNCLQKYICFTNLLNCKKLDSIYIKRYFSLNYFGKIPWKSKDFGVYHIVQPGIVSEEKFVPENIKSPPYVLSAFTPNLESSPEIKNAKEIKKMKNSCKLAKTILDNASKIIKVGCTTEDIDVLVHNLAIENGAYPSPLNYRGFPKSVCTSVNNVACHGIPDDRPLQDGDIINVDVTVYVEGFHGDCSATFLVGNVDEKGKLLVLATEKCLNEAVSICKPGQHFHNIGAKVEEVATQAGFTVVSCFAGHGIGSYFHGPPDIFHCSNDYPGQMEAGMTFTIEPVLSQGTEEIVILEDGWTAVTLDNGRTAQFEHTVLVTRYGVEILTS